VSHKTGQEEQTHLGLYSLVACQKTIDDCGKMRSTHEKQCTTDPSASQLQGNTSVEFTHFKVRTPVGAPSEVYSSAV